MNRRTVANVRREAARAIGSASPTAALDARIIVAHLIGCVPEQLPLRDDEEAGASLASAAMALAERRARGEPIARLVGEKEFYGLRFALSPDTLIPRPDTETLVDAALSAVDERWDRNREISILDLGTGTGAILVALLTELPNARGVGIDFSAGAVETARANAERHGVAERVALTVGDWTRGMNERFDLVVSNPPYIKSADIARLQVDVRNFDPHLALDGGADGLDAIYAIAADLGRVLSRDGVALMEIGAGQADTVMELIETYGLRCRFHRDLAGIDRVAVVDRQDQK